MQKERPLSPHLQIYRPQITMALSITHRGTGIFLALCTPIIVYWLSTIAAGPSAYAQLQQCASHWFVQLGMLAWVFSTFYHLCNGIRHLFWDSGKGFEIEDLYKSGYAVITAASVLTIVTAAVALTGGLS